MKELYFKKEVLEIMRSTNIEMVILIMDLLEHRGKLNNKGKIKKEIILSKDHFLIAKYREIAEDALIG